MLTSLTRKLCPLFSFAALVCSYGCGKKMTEAKEQPVRNVENQVPSSILILHLQGNATTYPAERGGSFKMPSELKVNEGSTKGKTVTVFYNLLSNGSYNMKCFYKGNSAGDRILLTSCYDGGSGETMGQLEDLLKMTVFLDAGFYIQLQNPTGGLDVDAIYQMTWDADN